MYDYKFAFDNDDIDFIKQNYKYNNSEISILLEYCIIKNLPLIFDFFLNKYNDLENLNNLINTSITQKHNNIIFLEKLLDKYSNIYDVNKPHKNSKSIFNYTHLNLAIYEKKINCVILLLNY